VLQLLAEGRTMKEIARILKITPRTVAFHKYGMMKQLGVRSTAELVKAALKLGVVAS
jgi:DNA-binding CsgD family transcriptional regulator